MDVFHSDHDRKLYLTLMQQARERTNCQFMAWCLMSNHVHFIVIPKEKDDLTRLFQWAHAHYTRSINKRNDCTGHLWQERFYSAIITDSHLPHCLRYVLRNPVKAGLARKSIDYQWSSARFTFNSICGDPLIKESLQKNLVKRLNFLNQEKMNEEEAEIEYSLRNNFAYGDRNIIERWEKKYGVRLSPRHRLPPC
jgi:putative transposase